MRQGAGATLQEPPGEGRIYCPSFLGVDARFSEAGSSNQIAHVGEFGRATLGHKN